MSSRRGIDLTVLLCLVAAAAWQFLPGAGPPAVDGVSLGMTPSQVRAHRGKPSVTGTDQGYPFFQYLDRQNEEEDWRSTVVEFREGQVHRVEGTRLDWRGRHLDGRDVTHDQIVAALGEPDDLRTTSLAVPGEAEQETLYKYHSLRLLVRHHRHLSQAEFLLFGL